MQSWLREKDHDTQLVSPNLLKITSPRTKSPGKAVYMQSFAQIGLVKLSREFVVF